jgi:hypothetical protein
MLWRRGQSRTEHQESVLHMSSASPNNEAPTLLESQVLARFLVGDEPSLAVLRQQLGHLVVTSRESSSAGFSTHFRITIAAHGLVPPVSSQLNDVFFQTPKLENGGGFVLRIAKGYLELLEGYTFDEPWPETMEFRLHYFDGDRRDFGDIARRLEPRYASVRRRVSHAAWRHGWRGH